MRLLLFLTLISLLPLGAKGGRELHLKPLLRDSGKPIADLTLLSPLSTQEESASFSAWLRDHPTLTSLSMTLTTSEAIAPLISGLLTQRQLTHLYISHRGVNIQDIIHLFTLRPSRLHLLTPPLLHLSLKGNLSLSLLETIFRDVPSLISLSLQDRDVAEEALESWMRDVQNLSLPPEEAREIRITYHAGDFMGEIPHFRVFDLKLGVPKPENAPAGNPSTACTLAEIPRDGDASPQQSPPPILILDSSE